MGFNMCAGFGFYGHTSENSTLIVIGIYVAAPCLYLRHVDTGTNARSYFEPRIRSRKLQHLLTPNSPTSKRTHVHNTRTYKYYALNILQTNATLNYTDKIMRHIEHYTGQYICLAMHSRT